MKRCILFIILIAAYSFTFVSWFFYCLTHTLRSTHIHWDPFSLEIIIWFFLFSTRNLSFIYYYFFENNKMSMCKILPSILRFSTFIRQSSIKIVYFSSLYWFFSILFSQKNSIYVFKCFNYFFWFRSCVLPPIIAS